jgi:hypothetical protein
MKEKIDFNHAIIPVYRWGDLSSAITNAPSGAIIGIMQNMEATSTMNIPTGRVVAIAAVTGEVVISRSTTLTTALFDVPFLNSTLILGDSRGGTLVLDGESLSTGSPLVSVTAGSLTLNEGAVLRNNINTGSGGGVNFSYVSGTFNMNGGIISGNTSTVNGGGVLVSGTFNMNGGIISGNTATNEGGGVYINTGTFNLEGGTIDSNQAYYAGGGVLVGFLGSITKTGGTIYGNDNTIHTPPENTSGNSTGHAVSVSAPIFNYNSTLWPNDNIP